MKLDLGMKLDLNIKKNHFSFFIKNHFSLLFKKVKCIKK